MKKIKPLPLFILIAICLYTLIEVNLTDYLIRQITIYGCVLVTINLLIYFYHKQKSFYLTGLILLLGLFNIVDFTTSKHQSNLGYSIGNLNIEFNFQLVSLILFLGWMIIFIADIRSFFEEK